MNRIMSLHLIINYENLLKEKNNIGQKIKHDMRAFKGGLDGIGFRTKSCRLEK